MTGSSFLFFFTLGDATTGGGNDVDGSLFFNSTLGAGRDGGERLDVGRTLCSDVFFVSRLKVTLLTGGAGNGGTSVLRRKIPAIFNNAFFVESPNSNVGNCVADDGCVRMRIISVVACLR